MCLTLLICEGTGAFSEVYKVFRKSDQAQYALKKVSLSFRLLTMAAKVSSINNQSLTAGETVQAYIEGER